MRSIAVVEVDAPREGVAERYIDPRNNEKWMTDLDRLDLSVDIHVTFAALPGDRTRLRSTEVFRFKGLFGRAMSLFARKSIHAAHLQQMNAFKSYAERAHKGVRGLIGHDTPDAHHGFGRGASRAPEMPRD